MTGAFLLECPILSAGRHAGPVASTQGAIGIPKRRLSVGYNAMFLSHLVIPPLKGRGIAEPKAEGCRQNFPTQDRYFRLMWAEKIGLGFELPGGQSCATWATLATQKDRLSC